MKGVGESSSAKMASLLARRATTVGFYTMLSRVAGLVRDTVFAHLFGATHATDAFLMAFTVPNTFRMLVAEGALTAAMLPVLNETRRTKGEKEALRLLAQAMSFFPALGALATALAIVFAEPLVLALGAGFAVEPGKIALTVTLLRVMLPFLVLASIVAVAAAALNARQRFASSAASPFVYNLVHIAAMVTFARLIDPPLLGVAVGVLLGGAAQVGLQLVALRRARLLVWPSFTLGPEVRRMLRLMLPAITALAVYQVNAVVLRFFASYMGEAAVTYLYNAERFLQLPLGVFAVAIATVALPAFSDAHHDDDRRALVDTLGRSLRLTQFITVPATLALMVLALPIIATIFGHGRFNHAMVVDTAAALVAMSVGLVAISATRISGQIFFASHDFKSPVVSGAVGLLGNLALAPLLGAELGFVGLALSLSAAAWLQLFVQLALVRRRVGPLGLGRIAAAFGRDLLASAPMVAVVYLLARLGPWGQGTCPATVLLLALATAVGLAAYAVTQLLFRSDELMQVWGALRRRLWSEAP